MTLVSHRNALYATKTLGGVSAKQIRREYHQSCAQPGFRAEKKGATYGHFLFIFLCLGQKRTRKKPALNPGTRVSLVKVLDKTKLARNIIFETRMFTKKSSEMFEPLCVGPKNPAKLPPDFPPKFPVKKSRRIHQRASAGVQGEQKHYLEI